ncbi:uncharacterized protein N7483_008360 [Penicillium malachiteum]|uniref:uncharacterized protein n=1 Tax=Penicillium malachiteum TaxID=1324776 RepID=UPI002549B846|nr:uncharacterized protein N7483_008360 [Penicillium malachiteum]KAJ5720426.1 hypothetical protein N7483_008360 [Penicillium malachiteum]
MFDLPEAKRVRRNEVQSPASSRSPSPVDESKLQDAHARLGKLLNLDDLIGPNVESENTSNGTQPGANEEEEQEFEFRLFSAPTKTPDTTQKPSDGGDKAGSETQKLRIRVRSPTPGSGDPSEGRFVKAFRGWQYYFSSSSLWNKSEVKSEDEADQTRKKEQFEDIAVTGEQMMSWAKSQPWPGCHLPWRVISLKRHQTKLPPKNKDVPVLPVYVIEGALPSKSPKTRKKPGKKRRLILRKRAAAVETAKEADAEKRTRKNRERKLKRRQKAREEKAAAAAAAGGDVDMVDADRASSSGGD